MILKDFKLATIDTNGFTDPSKWEEKLSKKSDNIYLESRGVHKVINYMRRKNKYFFREVNNQFKLMIECSDINPDIKKGGIYTMTYGY